MSIDKSKLDLLFADSESALAENKAKSKASVDSKQAPADDGYDGEPGAEAAADEMEIPDEDKEEIVLNTGKITTMAFDWIGSLLIALVCVLLVMSFCFRVIDVDGTSMEPTLINTDKVIITDLFYTPHNGDIVVISHGSEFPSPLIKRVIAIPGQVLEVDYKEGTVRVDGELLDESGYTQGYLKEGDLPAEDINGRIPEGKIFVMGDNRAVSLDSRSRQVGLIDLSNVIGKAQIDVIPHSYKEGQISGQDKPGLDLSRIRYLY